ncbi:hypothetical protein ACU8DI_15120 [Psychroserpens sp. BH13MA-6]
MKKYILFLFFLFLAFSCEKRECDGKTIEIELINKAEYYFQGVKTRKINNHVIISTIETYLDGLNKDISNKVFVNSNFGYIQANISAEKCKNYKSFDIIFTESFGEIIRFNKDNDNASEYYRNEEFVKFCKSILNMSDKNIRQ